MILLVTVFLFSDDFVDESMLMSVDQRYGFGVPIKQKIVKKKDEATPLLSTITHKKNNSIKKIAKLSKEEKELNDLNISHGFLWNLIKESNKTSTSKNHTLKPLTQK